MRPTTGKPSSPGSQQPGIAELQQAIRRSPNDWQLRDSLGDALVVAGRDEEAIGAYIGAVNLEPGLASAYVKVGKAFLARGMAAPALYWLRRAMEVDATCESGMVSLAAAEAQFGCRDRVADLLRGWLAADPSNPVRRHLAAAILGEAIPAKASHEYLIALFDDYADRFDDSLARLEYCGPQLIAEALTKFQLDQPGRWHALDVGCGTGLVAPVLRPYSAHLVGVDLSGNMVRKAAERHLYDELHQMDMYGFMQSRPDEFDLLTAADVLSYCGDLTEFSTIAAATLAKQAWLIFTIEIMDESAPPQPYRLNTSGRYAHHAQYVVDCLTRHGLPVRSTLRTSMRQDAGKEVSSLRVVAQRATLPS